jgi:hypothetical protein
MHVLGHSFCEKRKHTKRPRDLHIRKVSFSGSSLSGCSLSSSDSTASAVTAIIQPQHADHAPRRLHERALLASPSRRDHPRSFFDDADSVVVDSEDEDDGDDDVDMDQFVMEMPPQTPEENHTGHDRQQEPMVDYFHFHLTKRPSLPRSRWSESTIQSVQTIESMPTPGASFSTATTDAQEEQGPPVKVEMPPNFSYKRAVSTPAATNAQRPPMKRLDSIEEFVKRGGWKRRGIVFNQEEVDSNES